MRKFCLCLATILLSLSAAADVGSFSATVKATAGGHSVTLQGCVSTTPGVSFNFYRGTAAGAESTTALNPTPLATCSWTDSTVVGNTTYYYVAKAYLASAAPPGLSGPSNEVTAAVPYDALPNAPTGLSLGTVARNNVPLFWNAPAAQGGYAVVAYEVLRAYTPALSAPALVAILPSSATAWSDGSCSNCYYAVRSMTIKNALSIVLSPNSNIVGPS